MLKASTGSWNTTVKVVHPGNGARLALTKLVHRLRHAYLQVLSFPLRTVAIRLCSAHKDADRLPHVKSLTSVQSAHERLSTFFVSRLFHELLVLDADNAIP